MSVTVPAPARADIGRLTAEIATAHGWPEPALLRHPYDVNGNPADGGEITVERDDADPQIVRDVIAAHDPTPAPQADPDGDLAARIRAVHDDPNVSAGVKKLTAALLGLNGDAAVAGRPTSA
jgi:hypothetical protein